MLPGRYKINLNSLIDSLRYMYNFMAARRGGARGVVRGVLAEGRQPGREFLKAREGEADETTIEETIVES